MYLCRVFVCDCRIFLTRTAAAFLAVDTVDLYNSTTEFWSTAQLSAKRYSLAATSVGNVTLFAGGSTNEGASKFLCFTRKGVGF